MKKISVTEIIETAVLRYGLSYAELARRTDKGTPQRIYQVLRVKRSTSELMFARLMHGMGFFRMRIAFSDQNMVVEFERKRGPVNKSNISLREVIETFMDYHKLNKAEAGRMAGMTPQSMHQVLNQKRSMRESMFVDLMSGFGFADMQINFDESRMIVIFEAKPQYEEETTEPDMASAEPA